MGGWQVGDLWSLGMSLPPDLGLAKHGAWLRPFILQPTQWAEGGAGEGVGGLTHT